MSEPRCDRCGRQKKMYLEDHGMVSLHCPHCTLLKRLLGRIDPITPIPENADAAAASEAYLNGEVTEAELESRLEDALAGDS